MDRQCLGAAGEVTGSCHLLTVAGRRILIDCGLVQGSRKDEARNREAFAFDPATLDAVVLSHAHIDHSGRLPLLVQRGYRGPIFTQHASRDLCEIMLRDAAFIAQKDAEWENRKRERKGLARKLVYSGDLGHRGAEILRDPAVLVHGEPTAQAVLADKLSTLRTARVRIAAPHKRIDLTRVQ